MSGPIPRAHGLVVLLVHHGPVDRERLELIGALTVQCYGAPKLTEAKIGRHGGEVAPAVERIEVRRRCSVWASEGTEKRNKEWHELWCGVVMR
jgi:hypothetical protein